MAKKEVFRLTEGDIKNIAQSVIKRILKEGSYETSDSSCWEDIKEHIGAEGMLDMLWNYLDASQIQDFLSYAEKELGADGIDLYHNENDDFDDNTLGDDEDVNIDPSWSR